MITARQIEDLLRQCEQRNQIKPGYDLNTRYKCDCGRVFTHITDLYVCSASHHED